MSTTTLKLIALVLMTVDHIGAFLPGMPLCLRHIGRMSACIFFFCAVEGFTYTSSKQNYLKRIYLMNLLMTGINAAVPMLFHQDEVIKNNVFLEMFPMLMILFLWERYKEDKQKRIIGILLFIGCQLVIYQMVNAILTFSDPFEQNIVFSLLGCSIYLGVGSLYVDFLIIIFYICRKNKNKLAFFFVGWCMLYFIYYVLALPAYVLNPLLNVLSIDRIEFPQWGTFFERAFIQYFQWMMIFSLPILLFYNNRKGKGMKRFFYIYYPLHILILYTVKIITK